MEVIKEENGREVYRAFNGFKFESFRVCELFEKTGIIVLGENVEEEIKKWVLGSIKKEEIEEISKDIYSELNNILSKREEFVKPLEGFFKKRIVEVLEKFFLK